MRYLRKVRHFALVGTILGGSLISFGCSGTNVEDNDTGDDSNVTNTQPTTAPVIQRLNDDDPTPKPSGTDCTGNPYEDTPVGKTVTMGTCSLIELTDERAKTLFIYAGPAPIDLVDGAWSNDPNVHINIWTYPTLSAAENALPSETREREQQGWVVTKVTIDDVVKFFGGNNPGKPGNTPANTPAPAATPVPTNAPKVIVTVPQNSGEYTRLTGECNGPLPRGEGHVFSADSGATVPAGTFVFLRHVNSNRSEEMLEYGCLLADTTAGKTSLNATDIWYGYESLRKGYAAACGQGIADVKDAATTGSWNFMYKVELLGPDGKSFGPVPATCPN